MAKEVSKTQIDRLGNRLKSGIITEDDLRLLDQYRRSFANVYETVVGLIRDKLGLEPTGRPAKSTTSIADKLKRESIRLTQIQDIAGCRLIVADIAAQESVIQSLTGLFQQAIIVDRREKPSHGYRAVHVIVNYGGKTIEIQARTSLQHIWAEMSEKYSDVIDPSIKYGGGDVRVQEILRDTSKLVAAEEKAEKDLHALSQPSSDQTSDDFKREVAAARKRQKKLRAKMFSDFRIFIASAARLKEDLQ